MTLTVNPLLSVDTRLPFDAIRADHVEPAVDKLLAAAVAAVEAIATSAPRTYAGTLGALEAATEGLEVAMGLAEHLESVLGDPALRAAYNAVQPKVSAFYASLPLHEGLYAALRAFAATPEADALDATHARHLEKTLDEFLRHGAELPEAQKARLRAIDVELAEITTRFSQNVVDETDAWELLVSDEARLAGLPESARAAARASAAQKNREGWRFTLHGPSVTAVLTYLDDPSLREQVYRAANTRAAGGERDNRPLVDRILRLRREKARLLGYRDVSDLLLHPRMVRSGEEARAFVDALAARTRPFFEREQRELVDFRRTLDGADTPPLEPWDAAYYAEKQRQATCDFDEEALRPYFGVDSVLAGMFELVRRLYGVRVTPLDGWATWHPEARAYAIEDEAGARLGVFYADLFPREGKRGGAWMRPFVTGLPPARPHVAVMCANVTAPIGEGPALLTHREVETLFHEFGHLLHHLLSTVEVRSLAGTNVAWDFVELPSQIMENWCWAREALDLFARHVETGEPIPAALFDGLTRARTFRGGSAMMRQLGFGTVDLTLHRDWPLGEEQTTPGDGQAVVAFARAAMAPFQPVPPPADYAMICGFGHLFGSPTGYAAGYYSYKWAEVLDADAFTRFEAEGLFSREVGEAFRRHVLSQGDSRDPAELYRAFMGRDPDQQALFDRAGLR